MKTKPQSDQSPENTNSVQDQNPIESVPNTENFPVESEESELFTDPEIPQPADVVNQDAGVSAETEPEVATESEKQIEISEIEKPAAIEISIPEPLEEATHEVIVSEEKAFVAEPEQISIVENGVSGIDVVNQEPIEQVVAEVSGQLEAPEPEESLPSPGNLEAEPAIVLEPLEKVEAGELADAVLPVAEIAAVVEKISETVAQESKVPEVVDDELPKAPDGDATDDDESDEQEDETEEVSLDELDGLTREELVTRLEELVKEEDVNKIKGDISRIKVAFLKLNKEFKHDAYQKLVESTNDPDAENVETIVVPDDEVEGKFKAAFQIYKQNKFRFNEEQEKLKIQNLEAKNKILEELKALISSEETLKKTYDEFKLLQDRWKSVGMVPKAEINNLWQNYHFLVEKFFDKVKINKELKDLDLKKNLEAKIELCGKAEDLLLETSIIKSFKNLQQYHEEWKEIGPVPQDKKDELWDRFRSATDKINERRREYYNEMQEGLEQNLAAKTILCEKAEQLISSEYDALKSWQDATNQMTELLQIWKTLGPAPKKQNNEIWARFKKSLDAFFNTKKDFYNKLKEQQMHNYNLKLDLCLQAEALRTSTDWRNTTRELINMQNEWKNLGPVPRKQSDKIWKRFRAACDEFFAAKNEYFKNVSGHEEENLKLKLDLIEKAKAFEVGENRNEAVETLKEYQRQWMEIGHVPIKEKEKLQTEFRALINKHFEKLKMDSVAIGTMNYRSRVDRMTKDSPDAGKIISKERSYVQGKIQQLQDEIKTWENNIGFFAKSKTANLLKEEFEKKIDKAKEELQLLTEKLKMLRETNQ